MPMRLCKFDFQRPFESTSILRNQPKIFVTICMWKSTTTILNVSEVKDVRKCLENHNRKEHRRNIGGEKIIEFAVLYPNNGDVIRRYHVEAAIRNHYNIPGRRRCC